jgi:hypothetical protein
LLVWIVLLVAAWPPAGSLSAQASASDHGAAQSAEEYQSLEPGTPIERELSGGQSHFYRISLTSGQYLQIVVDQRGIDVVVALFAPNGEKTSEIDSPNGAAGPEIVSTIAEAAGTYRIEVRPLEKAAKAGRYEIKVEALREATAKDKYRVAAESIYREAEQLRSVTSDAIRKKLEKYTEALGLYRRAGDRKREAETLIRRIQRLMGKLERCVMRCCKDR